MVDTNLIKKLRDATGCGMSDCNKALLECKDNYNDAIDWLRKKGLSAAAKKSARITTEGLIGIYNQDNIASIIEVNSETDFVAKNDKFQTLVLNIVKTAINVQNSTNYVEDLKNQIINNVKVIDEITNNIAIIGENLQLRRGKTIKLNDQGLIVSYLHNAVNSNLGKIGVLIALKSTATKEALLELGKQLSMHIAATKPEFLNSSQVPAEKLNKEKEILTEQAKTSGKPQNIIDKMLEGRIKKFYEENCLLDQAFVMNDKIKISNLLQTFTKENNANVEIQEFALFILGEGLEKKENNFAAEVAAMTK